MGATLQPDGKILVGADAHEASPLSHHQRGATGLVDLGAAAMTQPRIASSTIAWPLIVGGGLIAGTVWGINARLWMRYISTDPEFTWGGTLFIVIGFAIAGSFQSIAYVGRRRISTRWKLTLVRMATFAGLLPIFGGAGGLMAPTVLLGALAASHRSWPKWFRVALGIGAASPVVAVWASVLADFSLLHSLLAIIWLIVIYAVVVGAAQFTLAPQLDSWRPPTVLRLFGFACVVPLFLVAGFAMFVGI